MARARKRKDRKEDLVGQADPRAALDSAVFLDVAKPVLQRLEEDLVERAKASPSVTGALSARYEAEKAASRTAESFEGWTAALATQVAASWLLSCVFVRTLEDRNLLKQARLAGPGAEDSQKQFFQLAPSLTERDYLLTVFRELARYPAAAALFDAEHSLVWKLSPSAEVAKELLALFRAPSASEPGFRFGQASTRFLGDLYQDLSEDVRKRYALLQTPGFVETYILDLTLEPAIARFGLDDTTLIDPACGSGHFLLGAFDRLFEHRQRTEPGIDPRLAATKALDCIYGADINPYAVAIARLRLTLAFLNKAGYSKVADAPALPLHLVCADSLRINPQHPQQELWQHAGASSSAWLGDVFAFDDERAAKDVLARQYAAVVANPPYIAVKDAALREVYRTMYTAAAGKYALSAPFCERIFQLARPRGCTGQITANSFMKREFGKRLIEEYLPTVNLERIANTSGAYIPGHGTPTVLLFGTNEAPQGAEVHAVLAKRGEPATPDDPSQGRVWRSIVEHGDEVGFENDYLSIARVGREALAKHPWSLGGGGASALKELLEERAETRLGEMADSIGIASFTLEDDVFLRPRSAWLRAGCPASRLRPMVIGETIRDWSIDEDLTAFFPYDEQFEVIAADTRALRLLWTHRTNLANNKLFGNRTKVQGGLKWYEFGRLTADKLRTPLTITFAFVATHNHFVLDRGGKVFNRSAPIIKLPEGASEGDHLALLAYLNSSTACFWMKQVLFEKSSQNYVGDVRDKPERIHYEFAGTALEPLPIPKLPPRVGKLARQLDALARRRQEVDPAHALKDGMAKGNTRQLLSAYQGEHDDLLRRMVVVQEEIDWEVYVAVGLAQEPLLAATRELDLTSLGAAHEERPFLVSIEGDGILQELWRARRDAIAESPELALIEQPLFKRPWLGTQGVFHRDGWTYEALTEVAVTEAIGGHLESVLAGSALGAEALHRSELVRRLKTSGAAELLSLSSGDAAGVAAAILDREAAPFSAAALLTESGLQRRAEWEAVWEQQRREDVGVSVQSEPPSKYTTKDFRDGNFYRLRGQLDVPKERFISYPFCESDEDGEPVYGWAGWNHLQRAQALASLYLKRKDGEGWTEARLTPMLVGLLELIPWIKQWHNEPSVEFGGMRMGEYFEQFLDGECRQHNLTHDDLRAWRPEKKKRARGNANRAQVETSAAMSSRDEGEVATKPKKPRVRKKATAAKGDPLVTTEGD
jgi:hypothetical protein